MGSLALSPAVFSILNALVEERCGMHAGPQEMEIFGSKVAGRAQAAGFDSLLDYYYFLRYDPAGAQELDELIEALVVSETYFFREIEPLKMAAKEIIGPALSQDRRPRIWTAACASGEEPLTLSMILASEGLLDRVDIVATDISRRALTRARTGIYRSRAVRSAPDAELAARYLESNDNEIRADQRLVNKIDWRRVNLLDEGGVEALGRFDLILCRNVLIYFSDDTVRRIVDRLARSLTMGGVLLVGVSESLLRFGTALRCEERRGAFLYRKVG